MQLIDRQISWKVGKKTVGRRKRSRPGEAVDKAVGRAREAAGAVAGDKTMEAEGRTERRRPERNTYSVMPQPGGGWRIEGEGVRPSGVHRTKEEAVKIARTLAKANKPSQLLVYKKDETVQSERTYG
jgi:hypothetical protein